MKKDLLNIIEQSLIDEVKKTIINESKDEKKEFYHIMCEGEPIDTFESKEVAMKHLDIYTKKSSRKRIHN